MTAAQLFNEHIKMANMQGYKYGIFSVVLSKFETTSIVHVHWVGFIVDGVAKPYLSSIGCAGNAV